MNKALQTVWGFYPPNKNYLLSIDGKVLKKNYNNTNKTREIKLSKGESGHLVFNNNGIGVTVLLTVQGEDIVCKSLGEAAKVMGYSNPTGAKQSIDRGSKRARSFNARYL